MLFKIYIIKKFDHINHKVYNFMWLFKFTNLGGSKHVTIKRYAYRKIRK